MKNRFKCFSEDKCIHKNKVNDGKFDCSGNDIIQALISISILDKSDEDIHCEEDVRRAIYKLFKLQNVSSIIL